jgi:beta-N-acetylhexosaminidase
MVQKFLFICLLALCSPLLVAGDFQRPAPVHLDHKGEKWAEKALKKLSLEEKVGQLFMVRLTMPQFVNVQSNDYQQWRQQIDHYHLGSMLLTVAVDGPGLSKSEPYEIAVLINELQRDNKVPLLMAADYERGLSMRLNGVTIFPHAMAFGATGKPQLAERFGQIVAEESRAIGVEWNLFPDADVNSNPANPVINTRSFGEDPKNVGAMASAYIRGARGAGLLTAAKHFPGHGDTATDSHLGVAAVNRTHDQMEQIDLPPFRDAIAAGTDAVMVAHVTVPALEPDTNKVATISPTIVTQVLKSQLGFQGLVITDAMDMSGLTRIYPQGGSVAAGRAAVDAIKAGNDMLLLPSDLDGAYNGILNAVHSGEISEQRINQSVLKILKAKASVGLNKANQVDIRNLSTIISSPQNLVAAQQMADSALTLVRENGRVLPLRPTTARSNAGPAYGTLQTESNKLLCIIFTDDVRSDNGRQFQRELHARVPDARIIYVDPRIAEGSTPEIQRAIKGAENIIVGVYMVPVAGRAVKKEGGVAVNSISMPESTAVLLQSILEAKSKNTVVISFGSPYIAGDFPLIENYICTYSNVQTSETAAAKALFGEIPFLGRLPVSIPGFAQRGTGMDQPSRNARK